MAKRKATKKPDDVHSSPLIEISEEEQRRLIDESGILQRALRAENIQKVEPDSSDAYPLAEEIFNDIIYLVPISFCLLMMEM